MSQLFVTIGVCVRNSASTIREAIESIIRQTYPHELMEVIFVDDGSQDETLQIIKEYASKMDMNVKIFHHKWRGLGFSRNIVVNNARGKYIVWVDGDIVLPKDYVRKQVRFMEENSKVAIAGGAYKILNQSVITFLENTEYVAYRFKSGSNLPGTGGSIYRVKAVRQVGSFDENIKGSGEDIDIAYRVKIAGWKVARDTVPFYGYGKRTWKELWNHCIWHGYGAHYVSHKNRGILSLPKMFTPISFIAGIIYGIVAYKIFKRKLVFLLPLYFVFKSIAWWIGFIRSHIDGYGHNLCIKSS